MVSKSDLSELIELTKSNFVIEFDSISKAVGAERIISKKIHENGFCKVTDLSELIELNDQQVIWYMRRDDLGWTDLSGLRIEKVSDERYVLVVPKPTTVSK